MDKKDEVKEEVRFNDGIKYQKETSRKFSQTDVEKKGEVIQKKSEADKENKNIRVNSDSDLKKISQADVVNRNILTQKNTQTTNKLNPNLYPFNKNLVSKDSNKKPLLQKINGKPQEKNENKWGHRNRLRNRFRCGGIKGLTDYEALELLLFYTIDKIDTKSIAYNLINEFGSIEKVFSESYERILSVLRKDIRPSDRECEKSAFLIKFIRSLAILLWKRGTERKLTEKSITSGAQLLEYLKEYYNNYLETDMRDLSHEQFRVIFLDSKNKILKDEVMFEGTINQTGVYPRQILKRALEVNATAIIAVHNHPAGTLKPSNADISVTRSLQQACETLGISLLDHLIIGDKFYGEDQQKSFYSFAENGLL